MIRLDNDISVNRVLLLGFRKEVKYLFKDNVKCIFPEKKVYKGKYYEYFRYKDSLVSLINYGVHFSKILDEIHLMENTDSQEIRLFMDCSSNLIYRLNHYLLNSGVNVVFIDKRNFEYIEKYIDYIERLTCKVVYCDEIELSHFLNGVKNKYLKV